MSEAEKLYETLKKIQEPKGYFFNKDRERTFDLLEALLINRNVMDIWVAHAGCFQGIEKGIKISSVPVNTGNLT